MIINEDTAFFHTYPLTVEMAHAHGHTARVSCPDHRVPKQLDVSPAGQLWKYRDRTWPEVFPVLRCQCGRAASKLTVTRKGSNQGENWLHLIRICDDAHPFREGGYKHVAGTEAWKRHQALLATGAVRS